jgi:hypothetical protein
MGAAYDLMCENEGLENTIKNLRAKNRRIKKDLVDFINSLETHLDFNDSEKAKALLKKYSKPKKKEKK